MEFTNEVWKIQKLFKIFKQKKLDLQPYYQRNPIWSISAQKCLIDTIKKHQPIPNFFLLAKSGGHYEMVDGQQRARTILGYVNGVLCDSNGDCYDRSQKTFLNYPLNVTLITKISKDESIEEFYTLVNSSGLRLNRPELKKAEFYQTKFLDLTTVLAGAPEFQELKLFSATSVNRMNDVDFVSELIALIKFGPSEKKEKVDEMFEADVKSKEYKDLTATFKKTIEHFRRFNSIIPISLTRYKQKNDFYSLFDIFCQMRDEDPETLDYFYRLLVRIGQDIRPSQDDCEPLKNYAINCVTQSNSKKARDERSRFLKDLLLNRERKPNETQKALMSFYAMQDSEIVNRSGYTTLDIERIPKPQ